MKKFLKFFVFVVLSTFLTTASFKAFGAATGLGVLVISFVLLFLIYKAKIYYLLGRQRYMKDHDAGFKLMEKAYKTGRLECQDTLIYAYLLLRDGHLVKSEKLIAGTLFKGKKKLTQKNILAAKLNQAIIEWKKGDISSAIEIMEGIYDDGYRSTVHYQTLGVFYLLNNRIEDAKGFIKEAAEYNPGDASIRDNLGLLYIKSGEWEKAEEVYEELFDDETPTFIEAYYNYATVLEHFGDWQEACEYYQRALGCPERYLSTVKLSLVERCLTNAEKHLK